MPLVIKNIGLPAATESFLLKYRAEGRRLRRTEKHWFSSAFYFRQHLKDFKELGLSEELPSGFVDIIDVPLERITAGIEPYLIRPDYCCRTSKTRKLC